MKTDLIIIGSGPGGYRAAEYAAKNGLQVIIFEKKYAGGTCLNCGCIPTKTLCHAATLQDKDYVRALQHKNDVVEQLRSGVEQLMSMPGITLVRGEASFKDHNTITCNGEDYEADNIIIATGSQAKIPPIEGIPSTLGSQSVLPSCTGEVGGGSLHSPLIVTSTELLNLDHIPGRLVVIGAGVIGMEFASIFNAFGCEVTVIEFLKECLPATDSDIAKRLRKSLEKKGINFYLQANVKHIDAEGVTFERKNKEETLSADVVLIATGRKPNIESLNLDAAGISYDKRGIKVDPLTFEAVRTESAGSQHSTLDSRLFAIGDVNGQSLLAHAATMQGIHVVNEIQGKKDNIRLDIMPAAVFTTPETASVGLTEDQCKEQELDYTCKKGLYRANGKALAMEETEGILKLLAAADGTILGCHILGAHAADMVQEVAALMNFNATIQQLRDIVHIHPTLGEILQSTAELW